MSAWQDIFFAAKAIQSEIYEKTGPPEEGRRSPAQHVIPLSIVRGTRGYIERIVNQANGAYEYGWYDACAVMIRRLLETLIIEAYEHHEIAEKIKNTTGEFLYLRDLIDKSLAETSWNLGRSSKQTLIKLKDVGDKSAHSRRYNAHRHDLDPLLAGLREVVQEFVYIARLK